ncbi:hypothetical protein SS37A_29960 [Methylocystis iwaonis]|uniref:Uncharacterized protein n=1 Tax=Methylocystis iwaonis TaxID=2885079 RepID=A0ABM8EBT6_9HYPH|nr:hypothetical protein SS37A_29960 [Methylocystis iwaonis]
MHAQHRFEGRARRIYARKGLEALGLQLLLNRAQPFWALGMPRTHFVIETARMRDEKRFHKIAAKGADDSRPVPVFFAHVCEK